MKVKGSPLPLQRSANIPAIIPTGQETLVTKVLEKDIRVICICEEFGMGKTSLAKKVFGDAGKVREHFQVFAWVTLKGEFKAKDVLQAILRKLLVGRTKNKLDKIRDMGTTDLTREMHSILEKKRCLVVLEDVQDVQDWKSIVVAFNAMKSSSKILITTTSKAVAHEVKSLRGFTYDIKPLMTEEECISMVTRNIANFNHNGLQGDLMKMIFDLSGGSPLITLLLGRNPNTTRNEIEEWRSKGPPNALQVCYDQLSDELKSCLLYMGQFPIGKHIEPEKLYLMLAADSLILPDDHSGKRKRIPMESATTIMEKLSSSRLVQVEEERASMERMYKSCQLDHDQIRTFCVKEGQDKDFFEIVDFQYRRKIGQFACRLAVYLSKRDDGRVVEFQSPDTVKRIRSLLIFDKYESESEQRCSELPAKINNLEKFSTLRVLDFDGVDFRVRKLPKGMVKLANLIYLSFGGCYLENWPPSFYNFPSLETLDLRVNLKCKMMIPNILFNMKKLKHLYLPLLYGCSGKKKLQLPDLLEILVNFDTSKCNIKDLLQMKKLELLTAVSRGDSEDLDDMAKYLSETNLHQSSLSIRNLYCASEDRVKSFKKLLGRDCLNFLHIEGQIRDEIIRNTKISSRITEMIFDGSELEEDPMRVLGKVRNLRSLTLCNGAFVGDEMTATGQFPSLRMLKLKGLRSLRKLTFEEGTMPKLATLIVDECNSFKEVVMPKEMKSQLWRAHEVDEDDAYFIDRHPPQNSAE